MATVGLLAKAWRGAAGAMLVLAVFAGPGAVHSQARQPSEARVQLSWQPGWTSAGIAVEPGDTLSIRVRTIQAAADDAPPVCERNVGGVIAHCPQSERKQGKLSDTILNFAARQVILGRLGEGKPFVVGRNFKKEMKAGGPLSLRWNVPREAARAAQGFSVAIRVEPGIPKGDDDGDGDGEEGNPILTNSGGTGGSSGNLTNTNTGSPTNNAVEVGDNEVDVEPANLQGNVVEAEENIAAVDPVLPGSPEDRATVDPNRNVSAENPETSLSMAQTAVIAAALAAVLLALAAAGIGVQRWRRRRLVSRTRALLSVSPSLDLGEGESRGGGRPAEGPAASLRARLEEGAVHMAGGGKDG
jgi:hypothetical protein